MSGQAPHADLRRGTVTWDAEVGEYVADHGRPYGRPVVAPPQRVPTVCEACLTDTEVGVCPTGCPSRGVGR